MSFVLHPKHHDIWWVNGWVRLSRCSQSHRDKTSSATRGCRGWESQKKFTVNFCLHFFITGFFLRLSIIPKYSTTNSKGYCWPPNYQKQWHIFIFILLDLKFDNPDLSLDCYLEFHNDTIVFWLLYFWSFTLISFTGFFAILFKFFFKIWYIS